MLGLIRASSHVVTRDEMLAEIWNTPFAGSNKVDAVVQSLRKKLGPFAPSIETVTRLPLPRMEAKDRSCALRTLETARLARAASLNQPWSPCGPNSSAELQESP